MMCIHSWVGKASGARLEWKSGFLGAGIAYKVCREGGSSLRRVGCGGFMGLGWALQQVEVSEGVGIRAGCIVVRVGEGRGEAGAEVGLAQGVSGDLLCVVWRKWGEGEVLRCAAWVAVGGWGWVGVAGGSKRGRGDTGRLCCCAGWGGWGKAGACGWRRRLVGCDAVGPQEKGGSFACGLFGFPVAGSWMMGVASFMERVRGVGDVGSSLRRMGCGGLMGVGWALQVRGMCGWEEMTCFFNFFSLAYQ